MENPLITNRKILLVYYLVWLLIGALYFTVQLEVFKADHFTLAIDALIHCGVLSVLGLGVWYLVRFSGQPDKSPLHSVISFGKQFREWIFPRNENTSNPRAPIWIDHLLNHLFAMLMVLTLWLFVSYNSVISIPLVNEQYSDWFGLTFWIKLVFGAIIYTLIVLVFYLLIYNKNLQEKIQEEAKLAEAQKNAEIASLKAQINPHFLFNSMNSVAALIDGSPLMARDMIVKLSEYLRYTLQQSTTHLCTLDIELENIHRYLDIERVRFEDRLQFHVYLDKKCEGKQIPGMLLQPLVENAVKHGVDSADEQVVISLDIKCEGDFIRVELINNYNPTAKGKSGFGIGLENIRKRLNLIYNRNDLFKIENNYKEFKVIIAFPLQPDDVNMPDHRR